MKKRVWTVAPFFLIINILLFIMAFISLFYNKAIFCIEIFVAILSTIFFALTSFKFNRYVKKAFKKAENVLVGIDKDVLDRFPIPAVLVGEKSDIIWFNTYFRDSVSQRDNCTGENISNFIGDKAISKIRDKNVVDIEYNGLKYTVFGVPSDNCTILCFLEDTYYKEISIEFSESRPAVAIVMFDNREEFERNSTEGEDAQIVAKVESVLQKWAAETTGFFKKLNGDRYMIIMEERHVKKFVQEKFKVLEEIRNIKLNDKIWATVSIGLGRSGRTLKESEFWARKALDMALGRGGDQVVIKSFEKYRFFGGASRGFEKRSKVRTRVISTTLAEHIRASDCVLIMGHRFSDLDSVGAAVGMCSAVNKGQNKKSYIVINKKETLALPLVESIEKESSQSIFLAPDEAMDIITDKTLLIIVDTHSDSFVESEEIYKRCDRVVVIDHHRMMVNHINNALVFYHEPYASSASEMVTEIVQYISDNVLTRLEAEALLAGIMLDTKNFVLKTGSRTFDAASYLRRIGADTVEVKRMFSNSIDTYKVKYQLISGAEIFNNCAIACAEEGTKDIRVACAQAADELLSIQGVKASFVIYPSDGEINVSARSLGDINVQLIMEEMGGGGHQTMAGAQIKDENMEYVREKLAKLISSIEVKN